MYEVEQKEVEQRIGRNILLFQRMEAILKCILPHSNVAGYIHEIEAHLQERIFSIDKRTMGVLIDQFNREVLSASGGSKEEPEKLTGIWYSSSFKAENDTLKESLVTIVSGRNKLVHHLLQEMGLTSSEERSLAIDYLNQQYEEAHVIYNKLKEMAKIFQEIREELAAYFDSEQAKKDLDLWLCRFPRVMWLLSNIAREMARPDGWVELSTAGRIIQQEAPEELATVKSAFNQNTLKGFLLAIEFFDVHEEPTAKGGVRVLYRKKSEQTWHVQVNV